MKVLVTGVDGQIGGELMDLGVKGCYLIGTDRGTLDLGDEQSITNSYERHSPDLVINCAAYTAVDKAEEEPELAHAINAAGAGVLAKLCAKDGIPLIHMSTDYVFEGSKEGAYLPDDPVHPLGVYGASKEAGERAIRESCPKHVIIRTAWVFSSRGQNFVKTMLRIGETAEKLRVVADQTGIPTSAKDISGAIAAIVAKIKIGKSPWGTYHFCNAGPTTWYDFTLSIFAIAEKSWDRVPEVEAITAAEYPTKAKRPTNSVLNTETFETEFGLRPRPWQAGLEDVMQDLLKTEGDT